MKNVWNRRVLAALAGALSVLFFVTSCEDDLPLESSVKESTAQITPDIQRKIDFIRSTGFEQDSIVYTDGLFYIDGDIMLGEPDVDRRMKQQLDSKGSRTEQRKWDYLVDDDKVQNIKVAFLISEEYEPYNCSGHTCQEYQYYVGNEWQTAFENAITAWNQVEGSLVHFDIVDYADNNYDIRVYMVGSFGRPFPPGAVGSAYYPSDGAAGPEVRMSSAYSHLSANAKLQTAIHELGHTIGLSHTDDGEKLHISGTAVDDPASVMNASSSPYDPNFVLSTNDEKAVQILYPLVLPTGYLYANLADDYQWDFRIDYAGDNEYYWDFGDGTTRITASSSATHQYVCTRRDYNMEVTVLDKNTGQPIARNYKTVTAKHDGGGEQSLSFTSRLRDDYKLRFNVTGGAGCYGNKYFHWDFGDGSTAVTEEYSIIHQYPSVRTYYTVTVSTKDGAGNLLTAPISKTVLSKKDS